jgi:hypothetical protein
MVEVSRKVQSSKGCERSDPRRYVSGCKGATEKGAILVEKLVGAGAPLRMDPSGEVSWFRGVTEERPALR